MTREALLMSSSAGAEELEEVTKELLESEEKKNKSSIESTLESGLLDETESYHISRDKSKNTSYFSCVVSGAENVIGYFFTPIFVQSFIMTFLGEWGDRSQIASNLLLFYYSFNIKTFVIQCIHNICIIYIYTDCSFVSCCSSWIK